MTATASPPGTVLLAGATGDLGGRILQNLVGLGATVRVLTRPGTNTQRGLHSYVPKAPRWSRRVTTIRTASGETAQMWTAWSPLSTVSTAQSPVLKRACWRRRPRRVYRDSSRPISLSITVVSGPGATGTYNSVETRAEAGRNRNPGDVDP